MNACIYIGDLDNGWIRETFPGKSPALLPVVGKSWARHAVDICSLLKVSEIAVADCFLYPELARGLGDGSYWSTRISYLPSTDAANPRQLFEQHGEKLATDDLLIFWGQILPDVPDVEELFRELSPVDETPDEALPAGLYLMRDGRLNRCVCPLFSMDSVRKYFDLNMRLLNHPGIYNLPGYSADMSFGIGQNVITMFGCRLKEPLVIQDNSGIGRSAELDGDVIIGRDVLVDDGSYLKRAIVLDNTYIGRNMHLEDKIVSGNLVIDVGSGVHVELEDGFMAGSSKRRSVDRFFAAEFVIALLLLVLLLPGWLLALVLRKWLAKLPFFKFVLAAYPKLPGVLAGRTRLVRNGVHDDSYVFRFADQWLLGRDEHYRNMEDVFFSTHRSVRAIIAVVCNTLVKRMCTLSDPGREAEKK